MTIHSAPHFNRMEAKRLLQVVLAIIFITGAPVLSGVSLYAQTDIITDLTSLIRTVNENTDSVGSPADSVFNMVASPNKSEREKRFHGKRVIRGRDKRSGYDSLHISDGGNWSRHYEYNRPAGISEDDVVTNKILDQIIRECQNRSLQKEIISSEKSVLDFMTKVYADHNFYQTGHWDDAEDWSAITRNIRLPDYNPKDFFRPVWGIVTSRYGFRPSFGRLHKGIDLSVNIGDTVRAALPGVVAKVSYDPGGYGHYVVLVHNNGMETRYAHLQSSITTLGKTLSAGDPLGIGGNSGNSTGPHLHFEVRYRGTALDPASIFDFHEYRRPEDN